MKKIALLISLACFGCKTNEQTALATDKGFTLPAYQLDKATEKNVLTSIMKTNTNEYDVRFEGKIYSFEQARPIFDTLSPQYALSIQADSISLRKTILINKKE